MLSRVMYRLPGPNILHRVEFKSIPKTFNVALSARSLAESAATSQPQVGAIKKKRRLFWKAAAVAGVSLAVYCATREEEDRVYCFLPLLNAESKTWGWINSIYLPTFLRTPIIGLYAKAFDCNMEEVERQDFSQYTNLQDFFTRKLKEGAREIAKEGIVSPVDGKVMSFGKITNEGQAVQIKNINYSVLDLLAKDGITQNLVVPQEGKELFHAIIYLAPGYYHGIHSPCDWVAISRVHVPGYLLPVFQSVVHYVPGLFAINERVILEGIYQHGYFAMIPVGATNVGNIEITAEKKKFGELQTNNAKDWLVAKRTKDKNNTNEKKKKVFLAYRTMYPEGLKLARGEETAFFKLGSTVVLIFEAPKDSQFTIKEGQIISLGQNIFQYSEKK